MVAPKIEYPVVFLLFQVFISIWDLEREITVLAVTNFSVTLKYIVILV